MCKSGNFLALSRKTHAQGLVHKIALHTQSLCTNFMHKNCAQKLMHNAQGAVHKQKSCYRRELMLDSISRMLSCKPLEGLDSFSSMLLMA